MLGIQDPSLQERLLREPDLTLKRTVDSVRACEVSRQQIKVISARSNADIDAVNIRKKNDYKPDIECTACGRRHKKGECPAFNKLCNFCRKRNHAVMCRQKTDGESRSVPE